MFTRHYKALAYLLVNIKKQIRISKYSYRAKALVKYMLEEITDVFNQLWKKNGRKELADAITQQFCPDKKTSKESEAKIKETPSILLDFIDEYLSK